MASADFTTKPTQLVLEGLTSVGFFDEGGREGVNIYFGFVSLEGAGRRWREWGI